MRVEVSKEWMLRMAELEGDASIGAGVPERTEADCLRSEVAMLQRTLAQIEAIRDEIFSEQQETIDRLQVEVKALREAVTEAADVVRHILEYGFKPYTKGQYGTQHLTEVLMKMRSSLSYPNNADTQGSDPKISG